MLKSDEEEQLLLAVTPSLTPIRPSVPSTSEAAVFNFVTVRSPRTTTTSSLAGKAPRFIAYSQEYNSGFVHALARQAADTQPAGRSREAARTLPSLGVFPAAELAERVARTLADLLPLVQFGYWLRENQATLTTDEVERMREQLPLSHAQPEQLGYVWEALSRGTVAGDTQAQFKPLLAVLRAQHFLAYADNLERETDALRELAAAEVVLPTGVEPPARPAPPAAYRPDATPAKVQTERQTELQQQLAGYEAAITELRRVQEARLEEARNTPAPAVPAILSTTPGPGEPQAPTVAPGTAAANAKIQATYLAAQRRAEFLGDEATLSPETAEAVANLGSPATLRTSFLLEQLEQQASQLARQLGQTVAATQLVFQAGGVFWSAATPEQAIQAEKAAAEATNAATNQELTYPAGTKALLPELDLNTDPAQRTDSADDLYEGFYNGQATNAVGRIRPLGIADLNRVEQTLCCYKAGEVAHIENVMQGEYKERSTRRLRRTEDTTDLTTERESTQERDTTTSDRYEMAKESSQVLQQDSSLNVGVTVAGSWGPVSVSASTNFTTSSSATQTDHQTSTYAKSVTDRSLQRIVERVRTQRTLKITEEFEESNKHGLDNRGGKAHVVGLYRWVDKLYRAQVVNYGKRLMFEFMLPQPGFFHLWAMQEVAATSGSSLVKPFDPRTTAVVGTDKLDSAQVLTTTNYLAWAAAYGATVTPPPAEYVKVSVALDGSKTPIARTSTTIMAGKSDSLVVPDGYEGYSVRMIADFQDSSGGGALPGAAINVGGMGAWWVEGGNGGYRRSQWTPEDTNVGPVTGKVAISYGVVFSERFTANIVLTCRRTDAALMTWKLKTYQAIIDAYQARLSAYEQALAEAQTTTTTLGTNPAFTQQLIQTELKRGCINWLTHGDQPGIYGVWPYGAGDYNNPPHYNTDAGTVAAAERARFLEQCFEWELTTHTLYPYYWAQKDRWRQLYRLDTADRDLLAFLQAGLARVLVSVRPGYEQAALYFLRTGLVWGGGELPAIDSPIYRSVVDELKQPVGVRVGQPWEVRVPTALTVLQAESGAIGGNGLPCDCDPKVALGVTDKPVLLAGKE